MQQLWTIWPGQLSFLAAVSVIILAVRRVTRRFWPRGLMLIDFWPPFLIIFTHFLTLQATESSLVPYEVISMMILGIGLTIMEVIQRGEIIYQRFFKLYWRLIDLLAICVYLVALITHLLLK
ncbi:DUF3397 domain-containing protein [Lactiplantibacillus garii]|uniref:DUF3397 domain-containing protein n=1 Tax=Lactiplantibacillus garii TaxID=2306423 RepID=A0A3R8QT64_9LACO|nr:DUF3397 domain-containing protein [Lactiplantibacillus garii]RRK11565.1 DUF3397 domain-containing protein [Lactiplantibacillus garii]